MRILRTASNLNQAVRRARAGGARIGFVPTMGYLHDGHLALVRAAREECDLVVASIFVNPLQFAAGEDLAKYPRDLPRDHRLLRKADVDLLFEPENFYPEGFATRVSVERLGERLCGRYRPGHFVGVSTVVTKLLAAAEPDRLYLGRKDYQQAMILTRMVADLNLPVRVVICPTVREADGLAMSSRNVYLTPEERAWAPNFYRALRATALLIESGEVRGAGEATAEVERRLLGSPMRLQYAEALTADDLAPIDPLTGDLVLAAAVFLGKARLIDNVAVRAPRPPRPGKKNDRGRRV
ncbi:MAG: pantoate--beta-alanine ligase [Candidatus Eisenbacteria bacterium]|nr:pantoate--beta-alanine ligase [Candidatus Eisenbacteria bacterium]MCC7143301.1 pantoate--beta-alanine ligase [Candidatus Eisenbacteria bacterium]